MSDTETYHRRRAAQHRRMIEIGDPQYASIHRAMAAMHADRAASAAEAGGSQDLEQSVLPKK